MDDMEKDVKTVISAASTRAEDRRETTALMEPLLIAEGSRHRTGLTDFAVELAARSAGFTRVAMLLQSWGPGSDRHAG